MLPLIPVMVRMKVPMGVVGGCMVRMSKLEPPEPVTGAGGNGMLEPGNNPVTVKLIVPSNLFRAFPVMS